MSNTTIFKLKQSVMEDDLKQVGFRIQDRPATYWRVAYKELVGTGIEIMIPLEPCEYGERVIQYCELGSDAEELNPEHIEYLVALGWVEEIEI